MKWFKAKPTKKICIFLKYFFTNINWTKSRSEGCCRTKGRGGRNLLLQRREQQGVECLSGADWLQAAKISKAQSQCLHQVLYTGFIPYCVIQAGKIHWLYWIFFRVCRRSFTHGWSKLCTEMVWHRDVELAIPNFPEFLQWKLFPLWLID